MDILLVTGRFPQRSETFIHRKATELARRGHRVTMITRAVGDWDLYPGAVPATLTVEVEPPDGALGRPARAAAAAWRTVERFGSAPRATRRLLELCRRDPWTREDSRRQFLRHLPFVDKRPDIVHFEFLGSAAMHPLVAAITGAPVLVSCRGQDVHRHVLWNSVERASQVAALRRADAIHCVSDELARVVSELSGRRDRVWVNRPAIDVTAITPRRSRVAISPVRIVAAGRLVWVKGFDYLLAALAELAARGVDFHAEIIGDGELRRELAFSIDDLGLASRVTLVGAIGHEELIARLGAADVFALSSVEEGISNAVLEAMAAGLPIVTTAAGGMGEAVTDGVEGFVVPIRDPGALARRLETLATSSELRATMGAAARRRAESAFDSARQIDTFEAMYRAVSAGRDSP